MTDLHAATHEAAAWVDARTDCRGGETRKGFENESTKQNNGELTVASVDLKKAPRECQQR